MTSRRRFLARTGLIALLPFAWRSRLARADNPWLTFRPAAFDVATDKALIWVRCDDETSVRIQYAALEDWSDARISAPVRVTHATDCAAVLLLAELRADTRYRYRVADADGKPRESEFAAGTFKTAPAVNRDFSFVVSGDTHARYKPFTLFGLMRERAPDFFIHLGDTAYVDSPRNLYRPVLDYYRFKHREVRTDQPLQQFLAAIPTYAIWDDHEVENDFNGSHPAIALGRQAYREYWPLHSESTSDPSILYRRFKWTPACEFFVLDTRQYRDQGDPGPGAGRTMLGKGQLEWLKSSLKTSNAKFKFICSSVPFHHNGIDKWGGFKAERSEVVAFIRNERIRNVVILSADLHAAADLSNENTGLIEFNLGPIAAPLQPVLTPVAKARETARKDSYVGDAYNFGLIRITHRSGKVVLRHEVIDSSGARRYVCEIVAGG